MQVIRAEVLGLCFGVRDALALAAGIENPGNVAIHGQLVHNPIVNNGLRAKGFTIPEGANRPELPEQPLVLITAHGISDAERERLVASGKSLIDTTCPLVRRAHLAAIELRDQGYHVVVIGKPGHVEVVGLTGDLPSFTIVESIDDVVRYPFEKVGIVVQTTFPERIASQIADSITRYNPQAEVRYIDTICAPTRNHQKALVDLLNKVQAMVVVGGRYSNNTRELSSRCRESGLPTLQVESPVELQPEWFEPFEVVGLTAGTSTLDQTIDDVERTIRGFARSRHAVRG